MLEIRIHGRGGQGAVTTGQIMAIAAFYDNKYSQTFPYFGVERCGAPVEAFVRVDKAPIQLRSHVYNPDIVIVLDSSLLHAINVTNGLKEKGIIIVNTSKSPKELKLKGDYQVHTVDATSVALKLFKVPIVNTAVLGAFSAVTKAVSLKSLQKAVDDKFVPTKGKQIADLNKKAIKDVFEMTR